ncbi:MAG: hypothetical protein HY820_46120 [Acidobacteria bacterium]|nr:hypothetical protein [Acidobacteriota bacterium]
MKHLAAVLLSGVLLLSAADKKAPITGRTGNWNVGIEAVAFLDKEEVKRIIGTDLGTNVVVVEVTLSPKSGKELKVFHDDFQLRSYKDGQKSTPFAPSQLAGKGGLKLSTVRGGGGGVMANDDGRPWGGLGGGMPGRLPGSGTGIGNSSSDPSTREATEIDTKGSKDEPPLLRALKEKSLPEKTTAAPVKGLLYFPLDGKHKAKDVALAYNGEGGKLVLEFHQ